MNAPTLLATPAASLHDLLATVLGTIPEPEFDAITRAAARLRGCKLAFLSLVHRDMLWFKSRCEGPVSSVELERSICTGVIGTGKPLLIPDALADPRYAAHPFVIEEPFIRFYAGVPLTIRGQAVGSLCIVDQVSHVLDRLVLDELGELAGVAEALIEARLRAAEARDDATRFASTLASCSRLHQQLQQAERMAGIGSWRLTVATGALEYSDQVFAIHDLGVGATGDLEEALDFYPEPDRGVLAAAIEKAIGEGTSYDLELDFITAKGRLRRVRAMAEAETIKGEVVALVGVFQDVTERYQRQCALEREANTDPLTRLAGRRGFKSHLDTVLTTSAAREPLALVLIDLDHFKRANDRFGHAAGDHVLRQVAEALRAPWLAGSLPARLGGDEFVLVVTDRGLLADLDGVAARLLKELVVSVGPIGGEIGVSATLGICHCWVGEASRRGLLETADEALYAAKNAARGTAAVRRLKSAAVRAA